MKKILFSLLLCLLFVCCSTPFQIDRFITIEVDGFQIITDYGVSFIDNDGDYNSLVSKNKIIIIESDRNYIVTNFVSYKSLDFNKHDITIYRSVP